MLDLRTVTAIVHPAAGAARRNGGELVGRRSRHGTAPSHPSRARRGIAEAFTTVMVGLVAACSPGSTSAAPETTPKSDDVASRVVQVEELDAGGDGWAMVMSHGALWIQVDPPVDAIVRIDVDSGEAQPAVPGGHSVESGPEGLWVVGEDWLARVDPTTGAEDLRLDIDGEFALAEGSVWVFNKKGLHRIDPASGRIAEPTAREDAPLCYESAGLIVAFDSAWVACKEGKVLRISIPSGEVTAITTDGGSHTLTATSTAVWVSNYLAGTVSRIDPSTDTATTVPGAGAGVGITNGGGFVWASTGLGIAKIDPETGSVVETLDLGNGFGSNLYELVWDSGFIWASTRSSQVLKVDPAGRR